jgi:hypothetical protein
MPRMLALTDAQLGMLAIAATAVSPAERGRWLQGIGAFGHHEDRVALVDIYERTWV